MFYVLGYFILINLITFIVFYMDKQKALKSQYRTSERILLFMVLLGGLLGALTAIYRFRHKNKKQSFMFSLVAAGIIHIALIFTLLNQLVTLKG